MPFRVFSFRHGVEILGSLTLLGEPVQKRYLKRKIEKEIADCLARDSLSRSLRMTSEPWALLLLVARENLRGKMACSRQLGEIRGLDAELVGRYLAVLSADGLITTNLCATSATMHCALSSEAARKLLEILSPKPANDHADAPASRK